MPLNLEEQFGATDAMTQVARLGALDQVWTDYLERAERPIPQRDLQTLERLTDEMDRLLQEAPDRAGYLDYLVAHHAEELEEEYSRILESDELTESEKERLQTTVERRGDIVEYARSGANVVLNESSTEREALAAKMNTIRSGDFAPGDLSAGFICGLAAGCITGGLFAPPPANFLGIGAGVVMIAAVYARGEEC